MSNRLEAIRREKETTRRFGPGLWYVDLDLLSELGIKSYRAKVGDNFLAIIPPPVPKVYFGKPLYVHYNIGPNRAAFLCLAQMRKTSCPVCEKRRQLQEEGADSEDISALNTSIRYLFWIVDMKDRETQRQGVQLYDAPLSINDEIISLSSDKRTGDVIDISDPAAGKNLVFTRKGTSMTGTRYSGFELEDRDGPIPQEWLEIPDFEDVLSFHDYDVIKAELEGIPSSEKPTEEGAPPAQEKPSGVKPEEPGKPPLGSSPRRRAVEPESKPAAQEPPAEAKPPATSPAAEEIRRRIRERLGKK